MNVAMAERLRKLRRPEEYCSDPTGRCLWNVRRSGPCPRHERAPVPLPERLLRYSLIPRDE